jgi:hypothetical protein
VPCYAILHYQINCLEDNIVIRCSLCGWKPDGKPRWQCSVCHTKWNTFDTHAECPTCHKVYEITWCPSCKQATSHEDWYYEVPKAKPKSFLEILMFWKNETECPVTADDEWWIKNEIYNLSQMLGEGYLESLPTITPKDFDLRFTGTEEDAQYIFNRLLSLMNIDGWELQLMFYSTQPIQLRGGVTTTRSEKLHGDWNGSSGRYIDKGLGHREVWIELTELNDFNSLVATMAHELSHYKLLVEQGIEENDEHLTDLLAVALGFGIFMGNSYFYFSQWSGRSHRGWKMRRKGYLPEQVIAYAMAYLAHHRDEDLSWKQYLNKTMLKYFDQSYSYIDQCNDG